MEAVVLDWSGVAPAAVLDVDAVADFGGTWRRVHGTGGRLAFCRQRPDEAVDQLYVVLSNHDRTRGTHDGPGASLKGRYTVTAGSCSSTTTTTTSEPEATTTTLALPPGCAIYEDNHVYSRQDYENGSFFEFDARFDHYEYSGIQTAEMYRVRRCSVGGCSETLERTANGSGYALAPSCSIDGVLHIPRALFTEPIYACGPTGLEVIGASTSQCDCCDSWIATRCARPEDCYRCCPDCSDPCGRYRVEPLFLDSQPCPVCSPPPSATTTTTLHP